MRDGRSSLTEVALASGLADQHHLARLFRGIIGVTLSNYRRSLKEVLISKVPAKLFSRALAQGQSEFCLMRAI